MESGEEQGEERRHEVLGILVLAATVLMTLSLWSYDARGGDNLIGPVGDGLAAFLVSAFGVAAWLLPIEFGIFTMRMFTRTRSILGLATVSAFLVVTLVGCALLHLALEGAIVFGGHMPGGVIGEVLGEVLRSLLGTIGTYIVGIAILLITLVLRTPVSLVRTARDTVEWMMRLLRATAVGLGSLWSAWREAKALEVAERAADALRSQPRIVGGDIGVGSEPYGEGALDFVDTADLDGAVAEDIVDACDDDLEFAVTSCDAGADVDVMDENAASVATASPGTVASARRAARGPKGPKIVAPPPAKTDKIDKAGDGPAGRGSAITNTGPFRLPPTSLLNRPPDQDLSIDAETLRANAALLVEKLAAYGVRGRVDEIHPGPVVTMYEFEPQSGTKISKIAGLADDLAMALAAQKVRIVAPIPGKARVGFELPNDNRQTVYMREVLEDERWGRLQGALPVALGKDIAGHCVYGDLAKMPHLLVAGATGSGKSVGLNVMLASLLAKKTPEQVRMLMIDPKVVELAVFDGIPHMLLPVVTDMKKAALALKWAVDEMERRYQLFADAGARNITTYNERVQKVIDGDMPAEKLCPKRIGKVRAQGLNGEEVLVNPDEGETPNAVNQSPDKLPYVLVVVDEFADLMMVAAKDVEAAIARLAQKARAAGIHVILATQRPSVDVITGMIKANFPARIAFKVSQREDSKTILGRSGAEHLLGMGDMLMIPPGSSDLKRVHSAFISEEEVKALCDFLREQGKPQYDEEILKPRDEDANGDLAGTASDDPQYDRAVGIVAQAGYCSISHLQRQLSVGYNKAAKLVERMEAEGVVGPPSGKAGGRREVLIQAL